jgi:hypothetical protein
MVPVNDSVLFSGLNSLALSADGERAAVCVNEREVLVYALDQGRLDEHKVLPLATARREGIWPSTPVSKVPGATL